VRVKVESIGTKGRQKVELSSTTDSGRISRLEIIAELGNAEEASDLAMRLAQDMKRERPAIATQDPEPDR
jgi:hypothetical protein